MKKLVLSVLNAVGPTVAFVFGLCLFILGTMTMFTSAYASNNLSSGEDAGLMLITFMVMVLPSCLLLEKVYPRLSRKEKFSGFSMVALLFAMVFYIDTQQADIRRSLNAKKAEQEAKAELQRSTARSGRYPGTDRRFR